MFIKQYGGGPKPYLCIHGWSGDHRTFEPLVGKLDPAATLYAVDLPGYGHSAAPQQWTLDSVTTELSQTIASFGKTGVTVVGNCSGALLGLRAATLRPNTINRLVLIDPLAWWPWYFRIFAAPGWGEYAYRCAFANPVGRWISNAGVRSKRTGDTNLTEGFATVNHSVNLHYLHILREIGSPQEFAGIEIPIDIVFGSRTFGAVRESAKLWRSMWPQARVWELAGIGHLPIREAPDALAEIIRKGGACHLQSQSESATTCR